MTDEQGPDPVVEAAARGEEWAIVELYRDLRPRLLRYLRGRGSSAPEDLASETWLALAPQLPNITGGRLGVRKVAFTIARRLLTDERRKQVRRRTDLVEPARLTERAATDAPEGAVVASMTTEAALALVAEVLPPAWAEVLLLRVLGELSAAEVGEIVGKSAQHVRVVQHRALARLAAHMADERVTP